MTSSPSYDSHPTLHLHLHLHSAARRDDDHVGPGHVHHDAGHEVAGVVGSALWQREGEALEEAGEHEQQAGLGDGLPHAGSPAGRERRPPLRLLQPACDETGHSRARTGV